MSNIINIHNEANVNGMGEHFGGNCKPVICIETGEIYSSVLDAANAVGVSSSVMSNCCRQVTKTCKGKRYCFLNRALEHLEPVMARLREASAFEEDAKKYREIQKAAEDKAKEKEKLEKLVASSQNAVAVAEEEVKKQQEKVYKATGKLNNARAELAKNMELLDQWNKENN